MRGTRCGRGTLLEAAGCVEGEGRCLWASETLGTRLGRHTAGGHWFPWGEPLASAEPSGVMRCPILLKTIGSIPPAGRRAPTAQGPRGWCLPPPTSPARLSGSRPFCTSCSSAQRTPALPVASDPPSPSVSSLVPLPDPPPSPSPCPTPLSHSLPHPLSPPGG